MATRKHKRIGRTWLTKRKRKATRKTSELTTSQKKALRRLPRNVLVGIITGLVVLGGGVAAVQKAIASRGKASSRLKKHHTQIFKTGQRVLVGNVQGTYAHCAGKEGEVLRRSHHTPNKWHVTVYALDLKNPNRGEKDVVFDSSDLTPINSPISAYPPAPPI